MTKYKILWVEDDREEDELFDSFAAADEMALYYQACSSQGAEDLYLSNPGDYPYDEDGYEPPEYKIVEVREKG